MMLNMLTTLRSMKIFKDTRGQGLAEYGLILGLVAVVCLGAVVFVGAQISAALYNVASKI